MNDYLSFLRQWASAPLQVAALAPSGRALAELMTEGLNAHSGPIIELGPGTGVFTQAMIDKGIPQENLALIELNPDFAEMLQDRFPKARVYNINAAELKDRSFFERPASQVLSGLGLLSMPKPLVTEIIQGVFHQLKPGGSFVQFTYGPKCPVHPDIREDLGLRYERVGGTLRNFPPASVYRLRQK